MCGILITKTYNPLRSSSVSHRGTETEMLDTVGAFGCALTHSRLPIQTLPGDAWGQPYKLKRGGYLLYNGEIFNYPSRYSCDMEYLVDLFESGMSIKAVLNEANKWDGFWALVYVAPGGMKFCFTDPLGKKQLYYNRLGEICSEIRPLVRYGEQFDKLFRSSVLKWGYNRDDRTPWVGVRRMLPNRLYIFDRNGDRIPAPDEDYYDWNNNFPSGDLHELLHQAVEARAGNSHVPVGCLVSGGLDSAIIARLLNDIGTKVSLYTLWGDEAQYAHLLGEYLGVPVQEVYEPGRQGDWVKEAYRWNETPIDLGSVLPQHTLMQATEQSVVLTGDGADELFGGYRRARVYDSQYSDVFEELTYYHLPRLDRASMRFTIELRSPFLSHDVVKLALRLPRELRIRKKILKDVFRGILPDEIIDRAKQPLKIKEIERDPQVYRVALDNAFYNIIFHEAD